MKEKLIKQYLKFWIENWYKLKWKLHSITHHFSEVNIIYDEVDITIQEQYKFNLTCDKYNLIALITSKEFIEAIARWINKRLHYKITYTSWQLDVITTKQAIAIRDDKLEEFIINLWIWKQN